MNNNSFGLSAETLAAIVKVVASVGNVQRALIYGSRAKGTFRPNSDVDIMLEGDALTISDLSLVEERLDDLLLPWRFDVCARNRVSNEALIKEVDTWGRVVYAKQ